MAAVYRMVATGRTTAASAAASDVAAADADVGAAATRKEALFMRKLDAFLDAHGLRCVVGESAAATSHCSPHLLLVVRLSNHSLMFLAVARCNAYNASKFTSQPQPSGALYPRRWPSATFG